MLPYPFSIKITDIIKYTEMLNLQKYERNKKNNNIQNDRGFASESKVCNEGCNEQQRDLGNCRIAS